MPRLWDWAFEPPTNAVSDAIALEDVAATTHDLDLVRRLYAGDVVVTDAGCPTPGTSQSWIGLEQIFTRYSTLPGFSSLHHVRVDIAWKEKSRSANGANATADTMAVLKAADASGNTQFVAGHEQTLCQSQKSCPHTRRELSA